MSKCIPKHKQIKVGDKYGYLTVIELPDIKNKHGHSMIRCLCQCGNNILVTISSIRRIQSCGCQSNAKYRTIHIGDIFHSLTVIGVPYKDGQGWKVLCKCKCGAEKAILTRRLKQIKSCGCLKNTKTENLCNSNHPLYASWQHMKKSCYNKNYRKYNGKQMYQEWLEFPKFYEWAINKWKKGLFLSLINGEGNYTPENLHFITHSEAGKKGYSKSARRKK